MGAIKNVIGGGLGFGSRSDTPPWTSPPPNVPLPTHGEDVETYYSQQENQSSIEAIESAKKVESNRSMASQHLSEVGSHHEAVLPMSRQSSVQSQATPTVHYVGSDTEGGSVKIEPSSQSYGLLASATESSASKPVTIKSSSAVAPISVPSSGGAIPVPSSGSSVQIVSSASYRPSRDWDDDDSSVQMISGHIHRSSSAHNRM